MEIDTYDKILGGILASLSVGTSLGFFTGLPLYYGAGGGAAVSMGFMYYGMFRKGPVG
ncbi:MAG: hypothetical protein ABEK10_02670 [Candidatus Nanosalina sp.]